MKKILPIIQLIAAMLVYSSAPHASGGHDRGHHKGHHKHKHHHDHEEARYYPPQPYSPPPPQYHRNYDQRTHEGLAGGVVGGVIGYEVGNGNPLATGIGAAAGSYLGNEIAGRK